MSRILLNVHSEAMDKAEEALLAKRRQKYSDAKRLFTEALELEQRVAYEYAQQIGEEPTRSILFRSAASLAVNAEEYETAEKLVNHGLSGDGPTEIRQELRSLYDQIRSEFHLRARGITLDPNEIELTIDGGEVTHGITPAEPLFGRFEWLKKLLVRTTERLIGKPYRGQGNIPKEIRNRFSLYVRSFSPGSFTVSMYVGHPVQQLPLLSGEQLGDNNPTVTPIDVVKETIDCLRVLEYEGEEALHSRIPDSSYFINFVGLARQLQPDGKRITTMRLRYSRNSELSDNMIEYHARPEPRETRLALVENASTELPVQPKEDKEFVLTGTLMEAASSRSSRQKRHGRVVLVDPSGASQTIHVPSELMKDVVRPYFEESVRITVRRIRRDRIELVNVKLDDDF